MTFFVRLTICGDDGVNPAAINLPAEFRRYLDRIDRKERRFILAAYAAILPTVFGIAVVFDGNLPAIADRSFMNPQKRKR